VQGLLEVIGVPYTGSGPAACMRCTDKALAKYLMREAGIPTPGFTAIKESAIKELGVAAALGDIERKLGLPLVVKPASQGSALGVKFARSSEELPGAIVGALSYDRKVVIERYVKGRDLAVSVLDAETGTGTGTGTGEPLALPVVEAIPREEEFYNYESRYEIGMTTFVCPAELPPETTRLAQELALETYKLLGCHGVARVDLMLDADTRGAVRAGDQRRPRIDRNQPAATGLRRRRDRLRRARRADPRQRLQSLTGDPECGDRRHQRCTEHWRKRLPKRTV
jgi:D-alanine-D-alanine ligase